MSTDNSLKDAPVYERIYALVRQIPPGKVATYGQIAATVGACTARMAGYAMAAVTPELGVPWQRVLNRQGKISIRSGGKASIRQRELLEAEGVRFDARDRIDFEAVGWHGPDWEWLAYHGYNPVPIMDNR